MTLRRAEYTHDGATAKLVAEKIIAIGRLGIEDLAEISKLALKELTTR